MAHKVLLVDNFDSFTFNLVQLFLVAGAEVEVVRSDRATPERVAESAPDGLVFSPGPGHVDREADFGACRRLLEVRPGGVPILGVCLGHQGIARFLGAQVVRAREVRHGKRSLIHTSREGLFADLPASFEVMRYHSWVVDEATLPAGLEVHARAEDDGAIMALAAPSQGLWGVQFHPESIGTEHGPGLARAFLALL